VGVKFAAGGIPRAAALTAFAGVADRWNVPKTKRHLLLGQPERTVYTWFSKLGDKDEDGAALDATTTERISHVVSIYNALHRLLAGNAADEWMQLPNRAFGGAKPIDVLLGGRFEDLIEIRHYVDRAVYR
jgi:hypothetical protein